MESDDETTKGRTTAADPPLEVVDFPTCPSCGGQTLKTEYITLKAIFCAMCGWRSSERPIPR